MKPRGRDVTRLPSEAEVDALYGLEPVFEPGPELGADDAAPFVTVQCPYCGESFETRLDLSQGSQRYVEDCQICCQPIEFEQQVDARGGLQSLQLHRGD